MAARFELLFNGDLDFNPAGKNPNSGEIWALFGRFLSRENQFFFLAFVKIFASGNSKNVNTNTCEF